MVNCAVNVPRLSNTSALIDVFDDYNGSVVLGYGVLVQQKDMVRDGTFTASSLMAGIQERRMKGD